MKCRTTIHGDAGDIQAVVGGVLLTSDADADIRYVCAESLPELFHLLGCRLKLLISLACKTDTKYEVLTYLPWYGNEPNGGTSENCALDRTDHTPTLIDISCTNRYYYICQDQLL
ncbi:hypothetical protein Pmani_027826 [Petrolisthes manimaculis]|uniref:C-type lectin domain-containing protein n=1 Tax=Petrolisthes manimaculis TaxID=1843537 RepID=A0AAE1TW46_9EUCA|nr:hypothetical protein Pmani_027826 [Petrolisthes manimaculis]